MPGIYLLVIFLMNKFMVPTAFIFKLPDELFIGINHLHNVVSLNSNQENFLSIDDYFCLSVMSIFCITALFKITAICRQLWCLKSLVKNSIRIKSFGRVFIVCSDKISVPFCYSLLKRSYMMVPYHLLENSLYYRLAVKHEFQHIRQKDTFWLYLTELVKIVFCFNPFAYKWSKQLLELQEISCDEALVIKNISPVDYANCLFDTAKHASEGASTREVFSAVVSLFNSKQSLIFRRIQMLDHHRKIPYKYNVVFFVLALIVLTATTTAYATSNAVSYKARSAQSITDQDVEHWSRKAILSVFTYNYKNYQKTFESSSHYFTESGWQSFMKALKESHNLEAVTANKMTVTAVVTGRPLIKRSLVKNNCVWNIQIPLEVIFKGEDKVRHPQQLIANILATSANNSEGMAINELVINPKP